MKTHRGGDGEGVRAEERSLTYGVAHGQQLAVLLGADVFSVVGLQCHPVAEPLH